MIRDMRIDIFYGPSDEFEELAGREGSTSILQLVQEQDAKRNLVTVRSQGSEPEDDEPKTRPPLVYANTSDFSRLTESVITGVVRLIEELNPLRLVLQNPPQSIAIDVKRAFNEVSIHKSESEPLSVNHLVRLNQEFDQMILGQEAAKRELLSAVYPLTRSRQTTPIVVMLYGPSGVGKTETAKLLSQVLGGTLMRKQFSMLHSQKYSSYVFGGDHDEASLARDLLEHGRGVVLFDEFDKANPMFHSAFYELFDEGVLEDKNFRAEIGASIIICTSNYRSRNDIEKELGDALASRFSAMIEYRALSKAILSTLAFQAVDKYVDALDSDERALIDKPKVNESVQKTLQGGINLRTLKSAIENYVNRKLVDAALSTEASSTATT